MATAIKKNHLGIVKYLLTARPSYNLSTLTTWKPHSNWLLPVATLHSCIPTLRWIFTNQFDALTVAMASECNVDMKDTAAIGDMWRSKFATYSWITIQRGATNCIWLELAAICGYPFACDQPLGLVIPYVNVVSYHISLLHYLVDNGSLDMVRTILSPPYLTNVLTPAVKERPSPIFAHYSIRGLPRVSVQFEQHILEIVKLLVSHEPLLLNHPSSILMDLDIHQRMRQTSVLPDYLRQSVKQQSYLTPLWYYHLFQIGGSFQLAMPNETEWNKSSVVGWMLSKGATFDDGKPFGMNVLTSFPIRHTYYIHQLLHHPSVDPNGLGIPIMEPHHWQTSRPYLDVPIHPILYVMIMAVSHVQSKRSDMFPGWAQHVSLLLQYGSWTLAPLPVVILSSSTNSHGKQTRTSITMMTIPKLISYHKDHINHGNRGLLNQSRCLDDGHRKYQHRRAIIEKNIMTVLPIAGIASIIRLYFTY
jgi:hypothetical protein